MKLILPLTFSCLSFSFACYLDETTCDERTFGHDSFVCVCDGEYCDSVGDVSVPTEEGAFKVVTSSRDKHRFSISLGVMERHSTEETDDKASYFGRGTDIHINLNKEYQSMFGFGGAFSDSAGIAMKSLSEDAMKNLLRAYFAPNGIQYNLCRIPIAGTDFSTRPYSYDDDAGDVDLRNFSLALEDLEYKIPLIKEAFDMTLGKMKLFASAWSPPAWMKDNGKFNGSGSLLKEMWQPFSNYLVKFLRAYEHNGIKLWGLTSINEPYAGFINNKTEWRWNQCIFMAEDARDWIKESLGPTLEKENFGHLKFLLLESERTLLPEYPLKLCTLEVPPRHRHHNLSNYMVLQDAEASKYVHGISVHWYMDREIGPEVLTETQLLFPDKFLLYTEACEGFYADTHNRVQLGSWQRAENYASNIIDSINHYSTGWVDWNLALDMEGGPNWANNPVDAPVIVNSELNEFYKQPMFYAMGHFSKFISEASKRLLVQIHEENPGHIKAASLRNPSGSITVVVLNKGGQSNKITIIFNEKRNVAIRIILEPKSLSTVLFT